MRGEDTVEERRGEEKERRRGGESRGAQEKRDHTASREELSLR